MSSREILSLILASFLSAVLAACHENTDKHNTLVNCDNPPVVADFTPLELLPLQSADFPVLEAALASTEIGLTGDDFIVYEAATFPIDTTRVESAKYPAEEKVLHYTHCSLIYGEGTAAPEGTPRLPFESEAEFQEMITMYTHANYTPRSITSMDLETAGMQGTALPRDELNALLASEGRWDNFYAQYPEAVGTVRFGAPAFNASQDTALVYLEFACGDLCGLGVFVLLRFENGAWYVAGDATIWYS